MGLFVNTNVSSLNARRALNNTTSGMGKSFARLASGLRINTAKDDAAGLQISSRLDSQVRGLNAAVRNTNDGISLAQTVEGALDQSGSILQRMRELSVQAANDTNTVDDRESIQAEVDQLIEELDRIAETTTFNNQKVLDGSFSGAKFHVGANARETISVGVQDARSDKLGRQARYTSSNDIQVAGGNQALQDNDAVINGVTIRSTDSTDDLVSTTLNNASAISKAAAVNDSTEFTGVRAIVESTIVVGTSDIAAVTLDSTNNVTINGEVITSIRIQDNDSDDTLIDAINAQTDNTGVVASLDEDHRLVLTAHDGRNIEVTVSGNATRLGLAAAAGTTVTGGRITLQSTEQFFMEGNAIDKLGDVGGAGATLFGVNSDQSVEAVDVTTREGANVGIDIIDVAISQVSSIRADLGAIQNRMESTVRNLQAGAENLSAAKSRIKDADFAEETAVFAKNQILQQAGVSILAQANGAPNIALSLLG